MGESPDTPTEIDLPLQFQHLWRQGQRPDVRQFLAQFEGLTPDQVVKVLRIDQEARWRAGERVPAEVYLREFPQVGDDPARALELVYGEYRLRRECGEEPALEELLRRFPAYAEPLRQRIERDRPTLGESGSQRVANEGRTPHAPSGVLTDPQCPDTRTAALPDAQASLTRHATEDPTPFSPPLPRDVGDRPSIPGYSLVRELGRGGMGVVYQAHDLRRGRMVALKTMREIEPAALYRFKNEFRSLAGLTHPNLVTLYELVAVAGPLWFFTMELVDGVSFLTHVRSEPLSPPYLERLRSALGQLATGVLALHRAGKLHRDLKPSNVLVTRQGRVVVLDFGLAADLGPGGLHQSTQPHLMGTVAYMAPEQAACLPVSPAADWYAVGVMLYEALTGRLPFAGPPLDVLARKRDFDPPAPRLLVPEIPADLDALCMGLLRREPGERLTGEDVLRSLGPAPGCPPVAPPPPPAEVPLVGRQRHLRVLAEGLDAAGQGRTVLLAVQGRSGAGKTALVRCFLDGLAGRDRAVVLAGRCYEQEAVPYKALDSLVDALSRYLERLPALQAQALLPRDVAALTRVFPVLRRVQAVAQAPGRPAAVSDPQEVRRRGLAALRELLGRLADRQPLVLAIDDLQWGDSDSAALLADLLRPPDPPPLLLLACYRSEDRTTSPCLRTLLEEPGPEPEIERRELEVGPLTEAEGRELARSLLGGQGAEGQAEVIVREAGGNPFFVHELVQHVRAQGAGPAPRGEVELHDVLWERITGLPDEARRLLEVVAVAGRPVSRSDAARAAGLDAQEPAALACLRSGRLLRSAGPSEGEEVETYHDRIRETVVVRLEPAVLEEHHRRLAEVLEASGRSDPEVLAVHFLGGGEPGRAGHYYTLAADQAAQALAFDRAASLYRLALELHGPGGAEGRRLRARLADALANAGRGAESAREYLAAAPGAPAAEALELRRRAALQLLSSGHVDDGLQTLRAVLAAVGLSLPASPRRAFWALVWERLRLRLRGLGFRRREAAQLAPEELARLEVCRSAAVGLSMVDTIQGAYFQSRSLLLALRAGERHHLVQALAMEAAHESVGGSRSRPRTEALLQAAETLAGEVGTPYLLAMVALARGIAAALAGDWPQGRALCDRAAAAFREACQGVMWELGTAHRFALWPLMYLGEVAEIARRLPSLIHQARARDDLYAVTNLSLVIGTFVRLAADEPGRAREELARVMGEWSQQGFHVQHMNRLFDETQIDLYEGRGTSAWERITGYWPTLARSHQLRVQQVRIFLLDLRARSALAAATRGAAPAPLLRSAGRDARALWREGIPWAQALAQLLQAGIAQARGESGPAAPLLADAAARLDAASMRLHAAAARRCRGRLTGGAEGEARAAEAWMGEQGIRKPDRMTALLAPAWAGLA